MLRTQICCDTLAPCIDTGGNFSKPVSIWSRCSNTPTTYLLKGEKPIRRGEQSKTEIATKHMQRAWRDVVAQKEEKRNPEHPIDSLHTSASKHVPSCVNFALHSAVNQLFATDGLDVIMHNVLARSIATLEIHGPASLQWENEDLTQLCQTMRGMQSIKPEGTVLAIQRCCRGQTGPLRLITYATEGSESLLHMIVSDLVKFKKNADARVSRLEMYSLTKFVSCVHSFWKRDLPQPHSQFVLATDDTGDACMHFCGVPNYVLLQKDDVLFAPTLLKTESQRCMRQWKDTQVWAPWTELAVLRNVETDRNAHGQESPEKVSLMEQSRALAELLQSPPQSPEDEAQKAATLAHLWLGQIKM